MKSSFKKIAAVFFLIFGVVPLHAETVTTTTTTTTFRSDAPIYSGPSVEAELRELTLGDFQLIGDTKPAVAAQNYYDYQRELDKPLPNPTVVPYKMKITRVLSAADFQGPGISPQVSAARYNAYLRMNPLKDEGRYVYVLHTSVGHTPPSPNDT